MAVKIKYTEVKGTVGDAISAGFSELEELGQEMREWADNVEEKLSHTEKYERVNECAETLEGFDEVEVADSVLNELDCSYQHGMKASKKSPYPRWLRRDNAVAAIRAAAETLQAWIDNEDAGDVERTEEQQEEFDQRKSDAEDAIRELEEAADEADNVEFPGMFG